MRCRGLLDRVRVTHRELTASLMVLAACSGVVTSPSDGGAPPPPMAVAVRVGNDVFTSERNGTAHPAVDTVAVEGVVAWTSTNTGAVSHGIRSLGLTIFRNSVVMTGAGSRYEVRFHHAGRYRYDCPVHGAAMTGIIVVVGIVPQLTPAQFTQLVAGSYGSIRNTQCATSCPVSAMTIWRVIPGSPLLVARNCPFRSWT